MEMRRSHQLRPLILCAILLLPLPSEAHNGALAIAVPVEGIKVDGDLSDWPAGVKRYPILLPEWGYSPKDTADFHGNFRLAYNTQENALFLAVEVQDESYVLDPTGGTWNTQDGCEVYVDLAHEEQDSPVAQYVLWGRQRIALGSGAAEDVIVEAKQEGHRRCYEWRIDVGQMSRGKVRLGPGRVVGLDVVVGDKDQDGSFSWMAWGEGSGKFTSPYTRGDALLTGEEGRRGWLRSQVRWEDTGEGISHARVRIQSLSAEKLWVQVEADRQGACALELPEGRYRVELVQPGRGQGKSRTTAVQAGGTAEITLEMRPPAGKVQETGPGRGHWRNFGLAEGLRSTRIQKILQDRQGNLWFGTGGGVSRFDGEQFQTFTTQDGLVNNEVLSIEEDQAGNLWFGTGGGVSRFDGKQFQTFTTRDGLVHDQAFSIEEDQAGNLWFGTGGGVSRFDGKQFQTFTTRDGLASNEVLSIEEDREGHLWFGTSAGGVSRFDGKQFQSFTPRDGLAYTGVYAIAQDQEGDLWFGTSGGLSRFDGKHFTTFTTADGLAGNFIRSIEEDQAGNLWFGTFGWGASRYDGKQFTTFTTQDGLGSNTGYSILEDQAGNLWFGTNGGVSRYDGYQLTTFTTQDSLPANRVQNLLEDQQGNLWFSVEGKGACRYDGQSFTLFTAEDGLAGNGVNAIAQDREGHLWFGTWGGVSRYDGTHFQTYTAEDGLAGNMVSAIAQDREGDLWFGTWGGVSRFDGQQFKSFFFQDTLASNRVTAIAQDPQGNLWFGTRGGAYRYDGQGFTLFTAADGQAYEIAAITQDSQGHLWFGTYGSGLSRYDGQTFKTFTVQDGLPHNGVTSIAQDSQGHLWLSTRGGVSQYDGQVFQRLLGRDGLPDEVVTQVLPTRKGEVWIATQTGLTRYRPSRFAPTVQLTGTVTSRRLGPVEELSLPSSQEFLSFEFQGKSFTTRPEGMAYVYRLAGYDADWRSTYDNRAEYNDLPRGEYMFQVKAVDRDLNYSETPAEVRVIIHPPYGQLALYGLLGLALVGLAFASGTALRRHRAFLREQQARLQAQEQLNRELEEELQTAHELQMGLMPRESPRIAGLELAGRCIPANHVGGDFFQYFPQDGQLRLCLADVTGHAMEAAIPMVMFSGVLHSEMRHQPSLEQLFANLNQTLHARLDSRTFVCFSMAQLELGTCTLRLANGGCPYPYHFRAAERQVVELQVEAYPLGVRSDTRYQTIAVALAPGDYVVFCSDGIIEAANGAGEMFGFERTGEVIRKGCQEDLSAEALLERIVQEVKAFSQGVPQGDDQTVVVLKVEG